MGTDRPIGLHDVIAVYGRPDQRAESLGAIGGVHSADVRDDRDVALARVDALVTRLNAYANWLWDHNEGADQIVAEKLREILAEHFLNLTDFDPPTGA